MTFLDHETLHVSLGPSKLSIQDNYNPKERNMISYYPMAFT